jgi:hypothetical protein
MMAVLLVGSLLGMAGCKAPEAGKYEIAGTVKFKGQPLAAGSIRFIPIARDGAGSGARIVHGKFVIPQRRGLAPGMYKVEIRSGTASASAGDEAGEPGPEGKDPIPSKYHDATTLEIEVQKGGPTQPFAFDLDGG